MNSSRQCLQVEAARAAATPAQRLLDDALQILAGTAQIEYQARKQVGYCDALCCCARSHGICAVCQWGAGAQTHEVVPLLCRLHLKMT